MEKIGERLKKLRKEKGLTQQQLADELDLSKSAIVQYENNKRAPNFQAMSKLVAYFRVAPQYLSGETDARTRSMENYLISNEAMKETVIAMEDTELSRYIVSYQNGCHALLSSVLDEDLSSDDKVVEIRVLRDIVHMLDSFVTGSHYKQDLLYKDKQMDKESFDKYMDNNLFLRLAQLSILINQLNDKNKEKAYSRYLNDYNEIKNSHITVEDMISVSEEIIVGDINASLMQGIPNE